VVVVGWGFSLVGAAGGGFVFVVVCWGEVLGMGWCGCLHCGWRWGLVGCRCVWFARLVVCLVVMW